jgi:hypothetical protein
MEEKDSDYFFGRERETVEVLSLLAAAADRLPVLLGNSGVTTRPRRRRRRLPNMWPRILEKELWIDCEYLRKIVAAAASVANARDDEPSREAVEEFAHQLAQDSKKQGMSLRETANHLASSIWWSEKVQLLCPSYFYVNARRARYDYLLRQWTWNMDFGAGIAVSRFLQLNSGLFLVLASRRRYHRFLMCDGYEIARRLVGRRAISNRMRRASKFGRKVAVDFESDADFHKCRRCPVHSCLPTFHVCQQLIEIAR